MMQRSRRAIAHARLRADLTKMFLESPMVDVAHTFSLNGFLTRYI
jgi:hypothetical protein